MAERGCEAKIQYRTIDPGASRIDHDFEGRRIDRGPGFKEKPAQVQATVACTRCELQEKLAVKGPAPYGASNEAHRQVVTIIRGECQKLKDAGFSPEMMPRDWVPN